MYSFDLKGSTVDRKEPFNNDNIITGLSKLARLTFSQDGFGPRISNNLANSSLPLCKKVLKDINFISLQKSIREQFNEPNSSRGAICDVDDKKGKAAKIHRIIERDVNFLWKNNFMDYSLYIEVENAKQNEDPSKRNMIVSPS